MRWTIEPIMRHRARVPGSAVFFQLGDGDPTPVSRSAWHPVFDRAGP